MFQQKNQSGFVVKCKNLCTKGVALPCEFLSVIRHITNNRNCWTFCTRCFQLFWNDCLPYSNRLTKYLNLGRIIVLYRFNNPMLNKYYRQNTKKNISEENFVTCTFQSLKFILTITYWIGKSNMYLCIQAIKSSFMSVMKYFTGQYLLFINIGWRQSPVNLHKLNTFLLFGLKYCDNLFNSKFSLFI